MLLTHSTALEALVFATLFKPTFSFWIAALAPKHGLLDELQRRQINPSTTDSLSSATVSSTVTPTTYTLITPSPAASPIPITSQGQVVTTYVPILTLCPMTTPGASIAPRNLAGPYSNATAPFKNVTANGCITEFSASRTTVCDTTLKGIATQYHVTTCNQQITFSTLYGYSLSTIAPSDTSETGPVPTVETVTTYFQAPWSSLTDGGTPSDITQRVCSPVATSSQQCIDILEVWQTIPVSTIMTTTSHVDLTTTLSGPSILSIETIHIDITETLTEISMSTILLHEYSTEHISTLTTTIGTITPAGTAMTAARSAGETSTNTVTVYSATADASMPASSSDPPVPAATIPETSTGHKTADDHTTSTTTLQLTLTTFVSGTTTRTLPSSTATVSPAADDALEAVKRFFGI